MNIENELPNILISVGHPNPFKSIIAFFCITIIHNLITKITNNNVVFDNLHPSFNSFNTSFINIDRDTFFLSRVNLIIYHLLSFQIIYIYIQSTTFANFGCSVGGNSSNLLLFPFLLIQSIRIVLSQTSQEYGTIITTTVQTGNSGEQYN